MATSKTKDERKDRLFIVWDEECPCGPGDEVLALSLRGMHDNPTFFWAGDFITGRVVSMANMHLVQQLEKDIPLWVKCSNLEWWKLRLSGVVFCHKIGDSQTSEQTIDDIEMVYCSGPTAKDRWGIFAIGDRTSAILGLKEKMFQTVGNSISNARIWYDRYPPYLYIRESCESMTQRGIPVDKLIHDHLFVKDEKKWSHLLVRLNLRSWTLSFRSPDTDKNEWQHTRIVCSTDPAKIAEQAYKVFSELRESEINALAAGAL